MESENTNIPIQLDSVCSTQGEFAPRWFRYENREHEIETVTIESVLSSKKINFVGMKMLQYICTSEIDGVKRIYELRYSLSSHKWTFFRLLS